MSAANLITNADQCALASYEVDTYSGNCSGSNRTQAFYLAMTSGSVLASNVEASSIPGQTAPVSPVLQRQDGNFIGTVSTSTASSMIAFTASGSTLWTAPNDAPQIATSDNGVIGTSGTTYDQGGKADGQSATLTQNPTDSSGGQWPSWLGNSLGATYAINSTAVKSVASASISYATTFAALQGGNHSGTGTSAQQEWFPDLPSCPLSPPTQPPCAKEAIRDALGKLQLKLSVPCADCSTFVFNILKGNQANFYNYLRRVPRLFDGTRSSALTNVFCPSGAYSQSFCSFGYLTGREKVSDYMKKKGNDSSAASQTPSEPGEREPGDRRDRSPGGTWGEPGDRGTWGQTGRSPGFSKR